MQFLNEIREHLANFETEAKEEIHKFIDWLHTKYVPPGAPVVAPPETSYVQTTPSYVAPVVENVPAPVADAAPAADSNPAPVSDVPVAAQDELHQFLMFLWRHKMKLFLLLMLLLWLTLLPKNQFPW